MLIVCPNCATSYDVDVASLRPDGRRVRCVRCRTIWHAELPHNEKLIAAAEALAPVRRAVEAVAEAAARKRRSPPSLRRSNSTPRRAPRPNLRRRPSPIRPSFLRHPPAEEAAEFPAWPRSPRSKWNRRRSRPPKPRANSRPSTSRRTPHAPPSAEPLEDIETIAARRYPREAKRKRWRWPLSQLQSGILALIVANAIVIGWRGDFVRAMPQTASFYALIGLPVNIRGLDFDSLGTTTEQHEGVPILVVGGNIVNDTGKTVTVPHLRFAVRNAARQEIYSWTAVPPRALLPPGEAVAFHTRLASPPPDSHDVLVRFVNRNDILAGAR